jgi:peroxiredoxin
VAFQEALSRFEQLNAQVLGISVDSVFSHRAFADQLGGLTYPLLSDFHPRGQVTMRYGLWRAERGFSKRAVVIVDREGILRHSQVIAKGAPDVEEVLGAVKVISNQ